jgi:hypothetical protein
LKSVRLAGIGTLGEANPYLEQLFLSEGNQRFAKAPAHTADAHRPIGSQQALASSLALVESRLVGDDYAVPWKKQKWHIPRAAIGPGLRSSSIRIEEHLDGRMVAQLNRQPVQLALCGDNQAQAKRQAKPAAKRFVPPLGQSRWMDGFRIAGNAAWRTYRERRFPPCRAPALQIAQIDRPHRARRHSELPGYAPAPERFRRPVRRRPRSAGEWCLAGQLRHLFGLDAAVRAAHPVQLDYHGRLELEARQVSHFPLVDLVDLLGAAPAAGTHQLPVAVLPAHPQLQRLGRLIDLMPIHPVARPA